MITIDKLHIEIYAHPYDNSRDIRCFGREIPFKSGLNLIVGDNTSGKTTIARCLYYALAMEELISGKRGVSSLDKSVTTTFRYAEQPDEDTSWSITESAVYIQLSNNNDEIVTVCRKIKATNPHDNILFVWHDQPYSTEMPIATSREYYIQRTDDHNTNFNTGFYGFLANFAGLEIIEVPSRGENNTKLYLQTLFALCFIEQTRGWSDFFATIKAFNVFNPKQRIIEYAMGYEVDGDYALDRSLKEKFSQIKKSWYEKTRDLKKYLAFSNVFDESINYDITKQKINLSELRFAIRDKGISVADYIDGCNKRAFILSEKQNSSTKSVSNSEYNDLLLIYQTNQKKYDLFCLSLAEEQEKHSAILSQLNEIENEIKRYKSFSHVNNIITSIEIKICPICNQSMPVSDNIDSKVEISLNEINRNLEQLSMQKKFLKPLLDKLENSINNKKLYKLYLENNTSIEKARLLDIAKDNNINLQPLSQVEQIELVDMRNKVAMYTNINKNIGRFVVSLTKIYTDYLENNASRDQLKKESKEETPIDKQLKHFKNMLFGFDYNSNSQDQIYFKMDKKSSSQYLPIVITSEGYEEQIRSYSSASDFIRSIWAYYITLLDMGKNHPGFLIMDEPCQHSMKEDSLKALFRTCAKIKNKQTILFCSSKPHTEEVKENSNKTTINREVIREIFDELEDKDSINYVSIDPHAIMPL